MSFITSHPSALPVSANLSVHSRQINCPDVRPGGLVKLREIADKQTPNTLVAAHDNCNVVKDSASASDRDSPQMTSKAVAVVFHGMPSGSPSFKQLHTSHRS